LASLIECPGCQHKLTLPDDYAGQRVQCPKCSREFAAMGTLIPSMEVDAKAAPTPQPAPPHEPPPTTAYKPTIRKRERAPNYVDGPSVYCPECGTNYAHADESCPHCGYRNYELLAERLGNPGRIRARQLPPVYGSFAVLAAFFVPLGALIMLLSPVISDGFRRPGSLPFVISVILFMLGIVAEVVAIAFSLIWLYQAWRAVLERDEEYSPGLMVGLLAIPFFNLFWMFYAVPGLSRALQRELAHVAPNRPTNAGWTAGLVACVFMLIPYFQPVALCIFIGWMLLANNALHRLVRIHERLRAEEDETREPSEAERDLKV
jgi:hypothetical protein